MNSTLRTLSLLITITGTLFCGQVWGMESGPQISDQKKQEQDAKKKWEQDLIQAVTDDDLDKVNELLALPAEKKGDINAYDDKGWTVLYNAIARGASIEIIEKLIEAGADVNKKNDDPLKRFPIHAAVTSGRPVVLTLLIEQGAKVNKKDNLKATPLHLAKEFGHKKCEKILKKYEAKDFLGDL